MSEVAPATQAQAPGHKPRQVVHCAASQRTFFRRGDSLESAAQRSEFQRCYGCAELLMCREPNAIDERWETPNRLVHGKRDAQAKKWMLVGPMMHSYGEKGRKATFLALLMGNLAWCNALVLSGFPMGAVDLHAPTFARVGCRVSTHHGRLFQYNQNLRTRTWWSAPHMNAEASNIPDPMELGSGPKSSESLSPSDHVMVPRWWTGESLAGFLKQSPQVLRANVAAESARAPAPRT